MIDSAGPQLGQARMARLAKLVRMPLLEELANIVSGRFWLPQTEHARVRAQTPHRHHLNMPSKLL